MSTDSLRRFVSRVPRPVKSTFRAVPSVLSSRPSSSVADCTSGLSVIDVNEPVAVSSRRHAVSVEPSPVASSFPVVSSCPASSVAVSSSSVAALVFSAPRSRPIVRPVAARSRPVVSSVPFRRPVTSSVPFGRPVASPFCPSPGFGLPVPSASTFQVPFLVSRFVLVPVLLPTVFGFVLSFLPVLY